MITEGYKRQKIYNSLFQTKCLEVTRNVDKQIRVGVSFVDPCASWRRKTRRM